MHAARPSLGAAPLPIRSHWWCTVYRRHGDRSVDLRHELQQSLSSRLLSIPVNILIAWLTAAIDLFIRTARRCPRGQFLLRNLADLLAYVSLPAAGLCRHSVERGLRRPTMLAAGDQQCASSMAMGGCMAISGILPDGCFGSRVTAQNQEPDNAGSVERPSWWLTGYRGETDYAGSASVLVWLTRLRPGWPTPAPARVRPRRDGATASTGHSRKSNSPWSPRWQSPDRSANGTRCFQRHVHHALQ